MTPKRTIRAPGVHGRRAIDVACPTCAALAGVDCNSPTPHRSRVIAAFRATRADNLARKIAASKGSK